MVPEKQKPQPVSGPGSRVMSGLILDLRLTPGSRITTVISACRDDDAMGYGRMSGRCRGGECGGGGG